MNKKFSFVGRYAAMTLMVAALFSFSYAQEFGVLEGVVKNIDGKPFSGATVVVLKSGQETTTNANGQFTISGLRTGSYQVAFAYPGYATQNKEVTIEAGLNRAEEIVLSVQPETEMRITVLGTLREGQAKALNEQRMAVNIKNIVASDQIGNFPDTNAAEATQRVPGVNIARDQGEGRYVLVRGTEPRLNQTMINGETIPAPEGDLRSVALDVVPLDMLEAIEITKSITPDMDGESVGGTVNLALKRAPYERKMAVGADYGYNAISEGDLTAGDVYFGTRFAGDRAGIVATASFEDGDRGSHNFEAGYDDNAPEEFEQRDYAVNRKRIGTHVSLDFRANDNADFTLATSYSQFDDQEFRRRIVHGLADERLERELKDRFETQSITSVQFKGDILTNNANRLKFSIAHSYARESEPGRVDSVFRQEDVVFDPNFDSSHIDPNNIQPNPLNEDLGAYVLDEIVREDNFTSDRHNSLKVSYEMPFAWGENLAQLKFGFKYRNMKKDRDSEVFVLEADDDLFLSDFVDSGYSQDNFLGGRYNMGSFQGRNQINRLMSNFALETEKDYESDSADFEIDEDLIAGYGMGTFELGDNWTMVAGLRYETFSSDYIGYEVTFDEEGDYAGTVANPGDKDDDILMPQAHLRYRFDENKQFRAAITHSYARARFFDQVPYRLLIREDQEIEEGNPDLDITRVWNLDLMYESYFENLGLFTVGAFHKSLEDYIYIFRNEQMFDGEEYEVTRPLNGPEATLWGFELAFQKNFTNLPAPFDGFGVYLNYTYTDSEADFQERENTTLPGQADEMGNLALLYEQRGLSLRLSGNLHGDYLYEVGGDPEEDLHVARHFQWDLNASYKVGDFKLLLELINLNDEVVEVYQNEKQYPIQYERYKTWGRIGFKYEF